MGVTGALEDLPFSMIKIIKSYNIDRFFFSPSMYKESRLVLKDEDVTINSNFRE